MQQQQQHQPTKHSLIFIALSIFGFSLVIFMFSSTQIKQIIRRTRDTSNLQRRRKTSKQASKQAAASR